MKGRNMRGPLAACGERQTEIVCLLFAYLTLRVYLCTRGPEFKLRGGRGVVLLARRMMEHSRTSGGQVLST